MIEEKKKPQIEILSPAGSYESFLAAIHAGADAVYAGGPRFGARAFADNFTEETLKQAIDYAHFHGRKVYLTVNTLLKDREIETLHDYLEPLYLHGLDAVIVQDVGVLELIRHDFPDLEIHASTQMSSVNVKAAQFLQSQGVTRVVPAREISLEEIQEIYRATGMEIECFVHGALCYCYSGQCLLSSLIGGRSGNRGQCAQPCRLPYSVDQSSKKEYVLSPKDICTLDLIPELIEAGVYSFKIEGRMKSVFYVATVVSAYRKAIDSYLADPQSYSFRQQWMEDLCKASHREFTTGFYFHKPDNLDQNYRTSDYTRDYSFVGIVKSYDPDTGYAKVEQRNKMVLGDRVEVFGPMTDFFEQEISEMYDEEGEAISSAPHPQQIIKIKMAKLVEPFFMLRKRKE